MKVGIGSLSSLRLGITLVIVLTVISSPIVMLVNPSVIATSYSTEGSTLAPSTIGQDGSDFTTQAALSGVWARQTNNIVGAQSYYDIVFVTSTTGTIKFIDITFPAGTLIGAPPRLVEREGIGAGNAVQSSSTTISYTVLSPVSIPEGTKIRLEFFNLVNPTLPSTGYRVTVATKDAGGTIIDGPTISNSLNMKQIGTGQIADNAVTTPKIADSAITSTKPAESFMKRVTLLDDAAGNARGWDPDGSSNTFLISEPEIGPSVDNSFFIIEVLPQGDCFVVTHDAVGKTFIVSCPAGHAFNPPVTGAELHYVVGNLPENVFCSGICRA